MITDFLLSNTPISWKVGELPHRNRPFVSKQGTNWYVAGYGEEGNLPSVDQPKLKAGDAGFMRVFFYERNGQLLASSSLKWMADALAAMGHAVRLDQPAAYSLLSFGFMLEDRTLIQGVQKLRAGQLLQTNTTGWMVKTETDYRTIPVRNLTPSQWIDELDQAFSSSVEQLLPSERLQPARATLSGGLDSRLVVHVLKEHLPVSAAGTGQPGYLDEKYAREYSRKAGINYFYHPLENGQYLKDVASPIALNEGLVFYNGAAHMMPLYEHWLGSGSIWSGLLGDAILGSYHSVPRTLPANPSAGAVSHKLVNKALEDFPNLAASYPDEFTYKLYNRGFNGINNGAWSAEPFGGMVSPFMTKDFMKVALSIPAHQKFGQSLYLRWLWTKYPDLMRVGWEAIGGVPASPTRIKWLRKRRRVELFVAYKLLKDDRRVSMLPYLWWYKSDPALSKALATRYKEGIGALQGTLKKDAEVLFTRGNFTEKAMVLSLLEAMEYLNIAP